jgi:subtilisin family serine protease
LVIAALGLCLASDGVWANIFLRDSRGVAHRFDVLDDSEPSRPVLSYDRGPALRLLGRLGVGFAQGVEPAIQEALLEAAGARCVKRYERAPDFVIAVVQEGDDVLVASEALMDSPLVRFAEPIAQIPAQLHRSPNDPVFAADVQLHLRDDMHGFVSAWDETVGDPRVMVAVLDTGVDAAHPELLTAIVGSVDVLDPLGSGAPQLGFADDFHGTAVAGLIAAATDNAEGIAGMCWDCSLFSVRLIDAGGELYIDQEKIFDAFVAALNAGAWILNNSWGPYGRNEQNECVETPFGDVVSEAVALAENTGRDGRGSIVVWSAGNEGCSTSLQPHLGVEQGVVVSALDGLLGLQPYSNRGFEVDVCAVEGNFTTDITGPHGGSDGSDEFLKKFEGLEPADYLRNFRGTSAAAPVVSGALALILSANPNLTAQQARQCLYSSAVVPETPCEFGLDTEGRSPCFGFGRFDVSLAVESARSGECGGLCESDKDCVEGTTCGVAGLCEFGIRPGNGDDSDTPSSDVDKDSDTEIGDDPSEGDVLRPSSGCGCAVIGL